MYTVRAAVLFVLVSLLMVTTAYADEEPSESDIPCEVEAFVAGVQCVEEGGMVQ